MPHQQTLTARNDGGLRTVTLTSGGLGMVTDEPGASGTGAAPTPLETVIGALCGCTSVTFAKAAREIGLSYHGMDFEASFTLDTRGPAGERGPRPNFQAVRVQVRVHGAEPDAWLSDVAQVTEQRSLVRNLLIDAGVALDMTWTAVSPEASAPKVAQALSTRRWPFGQLQPGTSPRPH